MHKAEDVENNSAVILKESELNTTEESGTELKPVSAIAFTEKADSEQLAMEFYGHELRNLGSKKFNQWQKVLWP